MSLQVWLPLNGDLHNQGLNPIISTSTAYTIENAGKIGKCIKCTNANFNTGITAENWDFTTTSISFGGWIKINKTELEAITTSITYDSIYNSAGGTLMGYDSYGGLGLRWKTNNIYSTGSLSTVVLYAHIRNNSSQGIGTSSYTLPFDTWVHVLVIFNREKQTLGLYINGVLFNSQSCAVATYAVSGNVIQNTFLFNQASWDGGSGCSRNVPWQINDFRLYNHALSPKEVKEIAKGLVLHYPLNGEHQILVPSTYQQLEYLESTGTQYIDTGKIPQDTYEYRFKYSLTAFDAYKGPFGAYSAEAANTVRLIPNNGSNANVLIHFNCKANGGGLTATGLTSAVNQIVEGSLSKKSYYLKNITSNIVKSDSNTTDLFPTKGTAITANMCLFGRSGYCSKTRIYYFDTYNNGVCIQKLVPAKRLSDNVLGMYDVISNTFFTNAGTDTFTAGPNASITGTVYDITGYKNHGTVVGNLTAAAGGPRYKSCAVFNSGFYIKKTDFNYTSNIWSVSCWFKKTSSVTSSFETILGLTRANGTDTNKKFSLYIKDTVVGFVGEQTSHSSVATIDKTKWHHVCITSDGSSHKYYLDGILKNTFSNTTNLTDCTDFVVGGRAAVEDAASIGTPWGGNISDVRIYATALSADDIAELYQISKGGN